MAGTMIQLSLRTKTRTATEFIRRQSVQVVAFRTTTGKKRQQRRIFGLATTARGLTTTPTFEKADGSPDVPSFRKEGLLDLLERTYRVIERVGDIDEA